MTGFHAWIGSARRRLSITVAVVAILVVAVAAILGAAAFAGYGLYRARERAALERLDGLLAEQAAVALSLPVWKREDEQIRAAMRSVAGFPDVHAVVLYAPDGVQVRQILTPSGVDPSPVGRAFGAFREVSYAGELVGMVEVRVSPARLELSLSRARWYLAAFVGLLVLVVSGTLAALLWYVVLRPVREIERLARDAGRGAPRAGRAMRFAGELESLRIAIVEMLDLLEARYSEIQEEAKRFRLSERRFRILIDTIPDLIWLKDKDGVYLSCNTMFERFFGAKESRIVGRSDFDFVSAELAQFFREKDRKAIEAGGPTFNEEWIVFADDGHRALLETIKMPMFDDRGELIGVLGIGRDITRRREAEDERHRLDEHVAALQKQEAQGALVAGVSVNVGGILGRLRALAAKIDPASLDEPTRETLGEMVSTCRRGETVVQSLVRYARPELGKREAFDVGRLVQDLRPDILDMAGSRVAVEFELSEEPSWVEGDVGAMSRVLMDACLNAYEAMPEGGRLVIRTRGSDTSRVRIEIVDTGRGIAPDALKRVREPFYTTKGDGFGNGLGLSLAYSVVKAHAGDLQIVSALGSGTRVVLVLPRAPSPAGTIVTPSHASAGMGLRVLVVDDEMDLRDLTARLLRKGGCTVLLAASGEEAMRIFESGETLDVVVLDQRMPGMSGAEVLDAIRRIQPELPVLVASGHPDIEDLPEFRRPRVGFVAKPCGVVELMSKLHALLDQPV